MKTLDDDWLAEALSDVASVVEVPSDGPDRIRARRASLLAANRVPPVTSARARRRWPVAVALGSVAMLVVAVVALHGGGGAATGGSQALPAPSGVHSALGASGSGIAGFGVPTTTLAPAAPTAGAQKSTAAAPAAPAASTPGGATAVPQVSTKVIKTGTVNLEVRRGQVSPTVDQLTTVVGGLGGYVQSGTSSEVGLDPTANLILRVPVDQFETLLARARQLGTPTQVTTSGQDVTSAYVDLNAQVQALQATQSQYLQILAKATSIGDILSVEQQLNAVNTQLQQLEGQQMVLADQTSYGTLTVNVSQAGAHNGSPPPPPSGLAKAWDHARSSFTHAVLDVISASGGILVALLVAGFVLLAGRLAWPVVRRRLV